MVIISIGKKEKKVKKLCSFSKIKINIILYIFLGIGIILALLYPSYFKPEKIFMFDNVFVEQENDSNIIFIIITTFKTIVMGILINTFIMKYQMKQQNRYIIFSYLTILLYILLNTGSNRLNMIIPLLIFIIITDKVFKNKGRILLLGVATILITSVIAITVSKFNYKYEYDSDYLYIMTDSLSSIQEYTSNIRPVALGIDAIQKYKSKIGSDTFFNDVLGSIPILSGNINQENRLNYYYNYYVLHGLNTSQIIPMVVSSAAYFSKMLPIVFTAIIIGIIMYLEGKKSKNDYNNFLEMYMSIYLSFQLAFCCLNGNVQMIIGKLILMYFPVMIILALNKKIRLNNNL